MRASGSELPRCAAFPMDTPEGPVKLAAIRFNLENGKIGEFAIEALDGRTPKGPVKIGRFALKSLDIAGLLRMSAQFTSTATTAVARQGAGADSADRRHRTQGLHGAVQGHGQAGQHRRLRPGLGPVRRPDPEQDAPDRENVGPARCDAMPDRKCWSWPASTAAAMDLDFGAAWTESVRAPSCSSP